MSEQPESPSPVQPNSKEYLVQRPFRVKLRGSVLVLLRLPNKRSLRGAFHQLSISGGVIHLEKPLDDDALLAFIEHAHA